MNGTMMLQIVGHVISPSSLPKVPNNCQKSQKSISRLSYTTTQWRLGAGQRPVASSCNRLFAKVLSIWFEFDDPKKCYMTLCTYTIDLLGIDTE